jgi:hypothetical protein
MIVSSTEIMTADASLPPTLPPSLHTPFSLCTLHDQRSDEEGALWVWLGHGSGASDPGGQ